MVGVPGKYKGCETCRRRRVKCSNERPHCKTCANSRRKCEGYVRDRVFITGTPNQKGRVASHPKRATPPKPQRSVKMESERFENMTPLVQVAPLGSAWDDRLELSSDGAGCSALLTTLHTSLHTLVRNDDSGNEDQRRFGISFAPYTPPNLGGGMPDNGFWVTGQCLLCHQGVDGGDSTPESYCAFLFEQTTPNSSWSMASEGLIRDLGPGSFAYFPNHHFFVRVYRPLTMCLSLLSRRDTFISRPEWISTPWTAHSKSQLDILFDNILALPSILSQADQLALQVPTIERRYKVQGLLQNCANLEHTFDTWLAAQRPFDMWTERTPSTEGGIPFESAFEFRDEMTALKLLYYWMSQLVFHRCTQSLYGLFFEPLLDVYHDIWPELPQSMPGTPGKYTDGRNLAENICRGLDCVLTKTAQPDMLVGPMTVVVDYYHDLQLASRDGVLESMWLEAFRDRLIAKGQQVANVLQSQRWVEISTF